MEKSPIRRVMLVEDNEQLRESQVALINETAGFICVADCGTAEEALQAQRTSKPDVVVMDIGLGDNKMTGIQVTEQIKRQNPSCLVVMQTISGDNDVILKAIMAGADGYILKGVPNFKLIDAINKVLEGDFPMSPGLAARVMKMFREMKPRETGSKRMLSGKELPEDLILTPTQDRILNLKIEGKTRREIAATLHVKEDALKWQIKEIYRKVRNHGTSDSA